MNMEDSEMESGGRTGPTKAGAIRFALLVLGGLIGAGLAGGYSYLKRDEFFHAGKDSLAGQVLIFRACIIFIMAVYGVGIIGMRIFGYREQSDKIRSNRKLHRLLLELLLLAMFFASHFVK